MQRAREGAGEHVGDTCVLLHFHSLFLDGVFVRDEAGALEFHELDEPSPEQVADVAARTAKRVIKLLEKAGKSLDSAPRTFDLTKRRP
jgi:hypothetical protein